MARQAGVDSPRLASPRVGMSGTPSQDKPGQAKPSQASWTLRKICRYRIVSYHHIVSYLPGVPTDLIRLWCCVALISLTYPPTAWPPDMYVCTSRVCISYIHISHTYVGTGIPT